MALWSLPIVAAVDDEGQSLVVKLRKTGAGASAYQAELEIWTDMIPVPKVVAARLDECGLNPGQMNTLDAGLETIREYLLTKAGFAEEGA